MDSIRATLNSLLAQLAVLVAKLKAQTPPVATVSTSLYETAKSLLGKHLTLDESIGKELGCAEAMSCVLKRAGVQGIPPKGFPGTIGLNQFLRESSSFEELASPEAGAILVSVTQGDNHGHTGVFGKLGLQYPNDYGILSNNSDTGLLSEHWSWAKWYAYYIVEKKLETNIYRLV